MAATLTTIESHCIDRFVDVLGRELSDTLEEVWLFGSAAQGDMWADFWPMRSDIDLLVVTSERLSRREQDDLAGLTYRVYLECGRARSRPRFERVSSFAQNGRLCGQR